MSKPKNSPTQRKPDGKLVIPVVVALIGLFGVIYAAPTTVLIFNKFLNPSPSTPTPTETQVLAQPSFPASTSIPRLDKIFEINFSYGDRGTCVSDDSKVGGNDISQDNYFVFGKKYGYITYCNITPLVNQGNLEITADPHGSPDYFGYGVIIGFVGGDQRNLCSFEIIKDFSKTKVVFGEYINTKFKPSTTEIEGYTLDTNPHTVRMVLYPNGQAIGYVDEIKIAEHIFAGCSEGRIGFVAYGQGDDKISFDDMKLYALP